MSRIIKLDNIGTERKRLVRAIVISLRELSRQSDESDLTRDLLAFITFCLLTLAKGVETTVAPWEKRGYWVKADRFRLEWEWTGRAGEKLQDFLLQDQWEEIPALLAEVSQHFSKEKVSEKHRLGTPWVGTWDRLQDK